MSGIEIAMFVLGMCASGIIAAGVGGLTSGMFGRPKAEPGTCAGYLSSSGSTLFDDCGALRSEKCRDGRCSYHCARMCECAAKQESAPAGGGTYR